MLNTEAYNDELTGDPAPCYATDAEIEIAERLRHQLEQRYLARSTASALLQACSDKYR